MIDYRTYLTGLVAVFLALGLGMLLGSALLGTPSSERQQHDLRQLQKTFTEFSRKYGDVRAEADNLKQRLERSDKAFRNTMPSFLSGRLKGKRVAVILTGEMEDADFLDDLREVLGEAGANLTSVTRLADDWAPSDSEQRRALADILRFPPGEVGDRELVGAFGRGLAEGNEQIVESAAGSSNGIRLDGDYSRAVHGVIVIGSTITLDRFELAQAERTPERGLLEGLRDTPARVIAAEVDGQEALSTISFWAPYAPATIDNIDMATGQFSAVMVLAGQDGRFGLKKRAEQPIPDLP